MESNKSDLKSYPAKFAGDLKKLANEAHSWTTAQIEGDGDQADERFEAMEGLTKTLVGDGVLSEDACQQLHDIAVSACAVTLCQVYGMPGLEDRQDEFRHACEPLPHEVSEALWKRTQSMFWAAAKLACAEAGGTGPEELAKQEKALNRHARYIAGYGKIGDTGRQVPRDLQAFAEKASQVIPATVIMFSGCKDSQTSSDVYNTASFGLPADAGPGGAGGACTNAMIKALNEGSEYTYVSLLRRMREILADMRYEQIPMLSSSREMNLNQDFRVTSPNGSGKSPRALLVGINYIGTANELKGCHNDVQTMKTYLASQGYPEDGMKILLDDGSHENPTKDNIVAAMRWLGEGAAAGDSLFFHYSGHGASVRDDDNDEKDGKDETLVPVDFNDGGGLLRDDEVFQNLVGPLAEGVHLNAVLDCCHSGTILDLPYVFTATSQGLDDAGSGIVESTQPNPEFDFGKLLQVIQEHPAICAAAAVACGVAFALMPAEKRSSLGGAFLNFASDLQQNDPGSALQGLLTGFLA